MTALSSTKIKEVMQTDILRLRPDMPVQEARMLLDDKGVSGAPVVADDGSLIGVLSQTDLVRAMRGACLDEAPMSEFYLGMPSTARSGDSGELTMLENTKVSELMSRNLFCTTEDEPIAKAAETMRKYKIHRVFVTKQKQVVGIVTAFDLLRLLEN